MKWMALVLFVGVVVGGGWMAGGRSRWDGRTRFTVIGVGEEITVESFDPVLGSGVTVVLPADLMMETVGGKGRWRAGALAQLAKKYGQTWAAETVANYLGIGYTAESDKLGVVERWKWWRWEREVEWRDVDLIKEGLVREVTEADGQEVLALNERWQPTAGKWFVSGAIANENMSVQIINASGIDGAGNNAARIIENSGIKVDRVESGGPVDGRCVFKSMPEEKKKLGTMWVINQLGCRWEKGEGKVVILGKDYGNWWKGS